MVNQGFPYGRLTDRFCKMWRVRRPLVPFFLVLPTSWFLLLADTLKAAAANARQRGLSCGGGGVAFLDSSSYETRVGFSLSSVFFIILFLSSVRVTTRSVALLGITSFFVILLISTQDGFLRRDSQLRVRIFRIILCGLLPVLGDYKWTFLNF